jgi:myosin heavy subunit
MDRNSADEESWTWVLDDKEGFIEARVLEARGDGSAVVELPSGARATKKRSELGEPILAPRELGEDFPDMVRMGEVNEATILRAVRVRFLKELIYTNIGTILVAMNPFKRIDTYGPAVVARYSAVSAGEDSEPHAFQIASAAYRGVRQEQRDQSIIISGESGAGKTEATKHCLGFFAEAAGSSGGNMQDKLIKANPVLEAFGNAKTVRNNNSSRFGKLMEVHFNARAQICGCRIISYLLEKSRIVTQTALERNYHIFYQLPLAADEALLARLRLARSPEAYGYTRSSCCTAVPGLDDREEFADVLRSFAVLEFSPPEYEPLFAIVAGLLHLSNVDFAPGAGGEGDSGCAVGDSAGARAGLEDAAAALGMPAGALGQGLCQKLLVVGGSKRVLTPLTAAAARSARDSLAKALYSRLFTWLVARVNASMASGLRASVNIVGVLDIFGFEIFAHNTFEQLCINFCNEKLQQHFNTNVFKLEIRTYEAEGISYDEVKFVDNQDVLDMVEAKPSGLLVKLDDECKVPGGSDKGFLDKIRKAHASHARFCVSAVCVRAARAQARLAPPPSLPFLLLSYPLHTGKFSPLPPPFSLPLARPPARAPRRMSLASTTMLGASCTAWTPSWRRTRTSCC